MFIVKGQLIGAFETPRGEDKNGRKYGGDHRLEILHKNILSNGEVVNDILKVTVENKANFEGKEGQNLQLPVSMNIYQGKAYFRALNELEVKQITTA